MATGGEFLQLFGMVGSLAPLDEMREKKKKEYPDQILGFVWTNLDKKTKQQQQQKKPNKHRFSIPLSNHYLGIAILCVL